MDTQPISVKATADEGYSFDVVGILQRRWSWFFLASFLGLGIGAAYYLLTPKRYESAAELLVIQNDSGSMAIGSANGDKATVSEELLATHMKILQSDSIVSAAMLKNGFDQLPSVQEHVNEKTTAVEYVRESLDVTTGGTGRARTAHVLNVSFRHTVADECEPILRAIIQEYQEFTKAQFQDVNVEAANLISNARKELENEISALDEQYKSFLMNAPLLSRGPKESDIYTIRYEELAAELSQLAIKRDEAAARLDMVKTGLAEFKDSKSHNLNKLALIDERNAERLGILVTVERGKAETAAFQSMQPERMAGATAEYSSLLTMKSRLKQLTEDFGPEYPEVRSLTRQIQETEEFLNRRSRTLSVDDDEMNLTPDDVMKAYVTMLEHDLRALDRRIEDTNKQMALAEVEAKKLVAFQLEESSLDRERDRQEQLYGAVIERLKNINMQREQAPLVQQMIQEPTMGEKVEPKGTIAAALAFLSALLLGAAGALLAEFRDSTIRSSEEVERLLNCEVMVQLPTFHKDPAISKALKTARQSKSKVSPTLLTHFAPSSRVSESFRALRTQVTYATGVGHHVVAVTSSSQGAGKSMLASNLSVSFAGLGQKTLIVDCDMRLPQVHKLFGLSNEKGLAEAILKPATWSECIQSGEVEGLDVMTSGKASANPAELLSRPGFEQLLDILRKEYAYIVLDCPPVLAVSDPTILAPFADGVLYVSPADKERAPGLSRAKKLLEGVQAKLLGVVINRSDSKTARYGGSEYGYGYGDASNYYNDGKS